MPRGTDDVRQEPLLNRLSQVSRRQRSCQSASPRAKEDFPKEISSGEGRTY